MSKDNPKVTVVKSLLATACVDYGDVSVLSDRVIVTPPWGMYDAWEIDFEKLQHISKLFKTRRINFKYDAGWGGTDITPGDPATLRLVISLDGLV